MILHNEYIFAFSSVSPTLAGLVVANRLSEDSSQRVLVLEAGLHHSEDPRVKTPGFYPILSGSELDWDFKTEAQSTLNGRSISLPQGKALGGSTAINAHVFVPPAKSLVDAWGTLGNEGWNWDTLKSYFAKCYTSPPVDKVLNKELGIDEWTSKSDTKGPIQTSFSGDSSHPIREAWANTFKASGYSMASDPFLDESVGAFSCFASIYLSKKERSYATSGYYDPVRDRKNLRVITNAFVEKIVFEKTLLETGDEATHATGVRYKCNGETKTVSCTKEVILSAGVLQSPKVLELSGIGDAELLKSHRIPLVENLSAIGENLHDHLLCSISYEAVDDLDTLDDLVRQDPEAITEAVQEYTTNQTGLLTSVGVNTYAYLPILGEDHEGIKKLLDQNRPPPGIRSEEVRARAYYEVAEKTLLNPKEPSGAYLSALAQHILPVATDSAIPPGPVLGKFLSIGLMLSQPLSRGSVHIRSSAPSTTPIIDPRYLSNPIDIEVMARHMRYIDTIAASSPLSKLLKKPLSRRDPASNFIDIEDAKKYLQASSISMWHLAGTCAMLPKEKGGVVDNELKVYGVRNLRVVDSSAIPLVSTANLQATVYAFAERAADLIKKAYKLKMGGVISL
ncbi:putative glucose-methanol-choline oxidoreductase [Biscogniauxia marginata]|nr:putative glucose-methanol-choline oxidoreductase [Biscogniauxia marginata]